MTRAEVLDLVRRVLRAEFELEGPEIGEHTHLVDDLDLDSIDGIDLVVSLEAETGLDVSEEELKAMRVVQDVVDLVHRKLAESEVG